MAHVASKLKIHKKNSGIKRIDRVEDGRNSFLLAAHAPPARQPVGDELHVGVVSKPRTGKRMGMNHEPIIYIVDQIVHSMYELIVFI